MRFLLRLDPRAKAVSWGSWFCAFRHPKVLPEDPSLDAYEVRFHSSKQPVQQRVVFLQRALVLYPFSD